MAKEVLEDMSMDALLRAIPFLVKLPKTPMRLDYDTESDVLYLYFAEESSSPHSEIRDDGIILDYKGNRLIGLTILAASQRE